MTNGIFVEKNENVEIMGSDLINDYDQNSKINHMKIPGFLLFKVKNNIKNF